MKVYAEYDPSEKGDIGILCQDLEEIQEFRDSVIMRRVIELHAATNTDRIHPQNFVEMCAKLSNKASIHQKRQCMCCAFFTVNFVAAEMVSIYDHDNRVRLPSTGLPM